jgi:hypothetical protein
VIKFFGAKEFECLIVVRMMNQQSKGSDMK